MGVFEVNEVGNVGATLTQVSSPEERALTTNHTHFKKGLGDRRGNIPLICKAGAGNRSTPVQTLKGAV
jgi:hypothetical protein